MKVILHSVVAAGAFALPLHADEVKAPLTQPSQPARGEPTIAGIAIREHRELSSDEKPDERMGSLFNRCAVTLRITGDGLANVTLIKDVNIQEARDDLGNDLLPISMTADMDDMLQLLNEQLSEKKPGGGLAERRRIQDLPRRREQPDMRLSIPRTLEGIEVGFNLDQPLRKAAFIKTLKGSFTLLAGGTSQKVLIEKPLSTLDKDLEDPVLKEAGIRLSISKSHERLRIPADDRALWFKVDGNVEALSRIRVLDEKGKSIGDSIPSIDRAGQDTSVPCFVDRPIDDNCRIELSISKDQKPIKVKLDLKDIPLP